MSLELAIRERVGRYLAGDLSLQAFHSWFVPATWDHYGEHPILDDVMGTVDLAMAEYTSGHLTVEELHERLKPLVTNYRTEIVFGA